MFIDFPSSCLGMSIMKYDVQMLARILYLLAKSATLFTWSFLRDVEISCVVYLNDRSVSMVMALFFTRQTFKNSRSKGFN